MANGTAHRINRAIELLPQDQAIYYPGPHSGHVLTYAQGKEDLGTWADYINVGWSMVRSTWRAWPSLMRGLGRWRSDALRPSHARQ